MIGDNEKIIFLDISDTYYKIYTYVRDRYTYMYLRITV